MDVARGLIAILKTAAGALRAARIPYCLAGGLAVSMLARPRATEDVDLIVAVETAGLPRLEQVLRQVFDVVQVSPVRRFANASIWRFLVDVENFPGHLAILDLILADRDEFRQAIAHAVTLELEGVKIAVADAERLIAVKRLAGRPIDLLDIESLQESLDNQA